MRLLVINPNTSHKMTDTIRVSAVEAAGDAAVVDTVCPRNGPKSIEGRFDEVVSAYWTLDQAMELAPGYDGVILACYSQHVVIGALREALSQPVVGIMEASIMYALPLGNRFSIVTTSRRWQPLLEEGVLVLGLQDRCASVRSTNLAVLDLERLPDEDVIRALCDAAHAAVTHDDAEVICLGCAGMAGLEEAVRQAIGVPVVDPVRAAVLMTMGMVQNGLSTSKRNSYSPILSRPSDELPSGLAHAYQSASRA